MDSIRKFFRHLFIPHKGNGHRPHFLRSNAVAGILGLVLIVELAASAELLLVRQGGGFMAAIVSSTLVDLTNQARAEEHVGALSVNPELTAAAQAKADDMAAKGYFAHVSPDGSTPWHWFSIAGYKYEYAGENLAVNFTDSADVVSAWMASPEHRANIEKPNYTEIGIATAPGTYQGRSAIFVVQMFGSPAAAHAAAVPAARPVAAAKPKSVRSASSAGKVLAAETKPAAKSAPVAIAPAAAPVEKIQPAAPAVPAAPASPSGFSSQLRALALYPGALSKITLEVAFGMFAAALLAALVVRKHLIHKETLRNGALALAAIAIAFLLHGGIFSGGVALPSSSASAAVFMSEK